MNMVPNWRIKQMTQAFLLMKWDLYMSYIIDSVRIRHLTVTPEVLQSDSCVNTFAWDL